MPKKKDNEIGRMCLVYETSAANLTKRTLINFYDRCRCIKAFVFLNLLKGNIRAPAQHKRNRKKTKREVSTEQFDESKKICTY